MAAIAPDARPGRGRPSGAAGRGLRRDEAPLSQARARCLGGLGGAQGAVYSCPTHWIIDERGAMRNGTCDRALSVTLTADKRSPPSKKSVASPSLWGSKQGGGWGRRRRKGHVRVRFKYKPYSFSRRPRLLCCHWRIWLWEGETEVSPSHSSLLHVKT